jgi:hypothetical protein
MAAPNPAVGDLIQISVLVQGGVDGLQVSLYSAAMKKVLSLEDETVHSAGWHSKNLDAGGLASGMYYFVVQIPEGRHIHSSRKTGKVYLIR